MFTVIKVGCRLLSVFESSYKAYQEYRHFDYTLPSTAKLVGFVAYSIISGSDIAVNDLGVSTLSEGRKLALHSGLCLTDVGKEIVSDLIKSQFPSSKLFAKVVWRGGDMLNFFSTFDSSRYVVKVVGENLETLGGVILHKEFALYILKQAKNRFTRIFREPPQVEISFPEDYFYICPISRRPIRHIVFPNLSEEMLKHDSSLSEIFYEKEAFEFWIKYCPMESPPKWPQFYLSLPLTATSVKTDAIVQDYIDKIIQKSLASEAKPKENADRDEDDYVLI